ncbi:hypothetical protein D3C80_1788800 [compost metagenome]
MRNGRPEQHQSARLNLDLAPVKQVGHAALQKHVELDVIVPMGRSHGAGKMALHKETMRGG